MLLSLYVGLSIEVSCQRGKPAAAISMAQRRDLEVWKAIGETRNH